MAAAACPISSGGCSATTPSIPDEYADARDGFGRLYFDTVLFDPRALRFLCDCAGAQKVMLGSDHPFPIGDDQPVKIVDATPLTSPSAA